MTNPLEELAAGIDPAQMGKAKISIDAFIAAYNLGEAELIDIRVAEETAVWQVNIGMRIPAPELPMRLDELPKDKLLVVACPHTDRSNMARSYLAAQGYNVKYLQGGLLSLMDRLKGVGAQDICLER
ncbi:rhodanese-like domain-containing protein [Thiocapsa sp. UBA6158]|jgi:rhodanese-related sulfurtransferase|uniref:rhodanese-like domain-containing protein n=1 Tax=Thiocapsa sp. UBA6158 TaxID=1947692 RepID=UPI0025D73864|nr:rhodanese-like domain-containing protein [Thiocapsa sp. UBA6158]